MKKHCFSIFFLEVPTSFAFNILLFILLKIRYYIRSFQHLCKQQLCKSYLKYIKDLLHASKGERLLLPKTNIKIFSPKDFY